MWQNSGKKEGKGKKKLKLKFERRRNFRRQIDERGRKFSKEKKLSEKAQGGEIDGEVR